MEGGHPLLYACVNSKASQLTCLRPKVVPVSYVAVVLLHVHTSRQLLDHRELTRFGVRASSVQVQYFRRGHRGGAGGDGGELQGRLRAHHGVSEADPRGRARGKGVGGAAAGEEADGVNLLVSNVFRPSSSVRLGHEERR